MSANPAGAQTSPTVEWVDGADAYEVAVAAIGGDCASLADDAGHVHLALATGENWPDALAASALDRPLLLSGPATLHSATRRFVEGCTGKVATLNIMILGGTAAISPEVRDELVALGATVQRIAGADRYETARKIAEFAAPSQVSLVYLATGANFADAIAAAPRVFESEPMLLTPKNALGEDARTFLRASLPNQGKVVILGGTAAVSQDVHDDLRALGFNPRRIAGSDRYSTAALIAQESLSDPRCTGRVDNVAVASGTDPYGGLAAASVRGPCQPLLLAPPSGTSVPTAVADFAAKWSDTLTSHATLTGTVTAIGGRTSVANSWVRHLAGQEQPAEAASGSSATVTGVAYFDDLVRDDSVILPAAPRPASRRTQPARGNLQVEIHACVQPDLASSIAVSDLETYADFLNEHEAPWFAWQSSGHVKLRFEAGEVIVSQDLTRLKSPGGEWGSYIAPADCIDPATATDGSLHHYLVVGTDIGGPCDGTGEVGGTYSSTYFRYTRHPSGEPYGPRSSHHFGRLPSTGVPADFRPLSTIRHHQVTSGVMYNIINRNVDASLRAHIDGLWHAGSSFYDPDAELGRSSASVGHLQDPGLIVGSFAEYPDSDTLITTYNFSSQPGTFDVRRALPCILMRGLGWPTGDNQPACERFAPPRPLRVSVTQEAGGARIGWQPPPSLLNPEPVTGYHIRVFPLVESRAQVNDGTWTFEVTGRPGQFNGNAFWAVTRVSHTHGTTERGLYFAGAAHSAPLVDKIVDADTTSIVIPSSEIGGTAYVAFVGATSAVGNSYYNLTETFQFHPVTTLRVSQRQTQGDEVTGGTSATPIQNPIVLDLNWTPMPGAGRYMLVGFEGTHETVEDGDNGIVDGPSGAATRQSEFTLHEANGDLLEGRSYDITVYACGDLFDHLAVSRPSGDCVPYAMVTLTATRLEASPVAVEPLEGRFWLHWSTGESHPQYRVRWTPHPDAKTYVAVAYEQCSLDIPPCDGGHIYTGTLNYEVVGSEVTTVINIEHGRQYTVRVHACSESLSPIACIMSRDKWLVAESSLTVPERGGT